MKSLNRIQIASIAAASLLVATLGVATAFQANKAPQRLDFPAILAADAASVDYFLIIDGIEGESRAEGHEGQIEIFSFSWGLSNTGSMAAGGGGGAGKVQIQDFHFTKAMSKASPKLFEACATGKHMKEAVLVARKAGEKPVEYLKITMTDVLITSYQTGGSAGDIVPIDSFSLNFAKIKYEYTPQKEDGTLDSPIVGTYDVKNNTKA